MKKAVFPGSFDPFTIGHFSIVQRGLQLFDEIVVAVGVNQAKKSLFSPDERIAAIRRTFANEPRVSVAQYNGLTVDFAQAVGADFILRGLRSVGDFEYEHAVADANRKLSGIETVILFTDSQYSFISSSVVRDLITYGKDISAFLPPV
ncbi:MAG: pantetheine-phosphate adenylyltransferase [Prevotellaceae bacterium]|jgi:pantetheine-phosphate adenylyltransferase|nr:pantetheine-phosphate adenylyltransferase [Prevotellaceae bacterium]